MQSHDQSFRNRRNCFLTEECVTAADDSSMRSAKPPTQENVFRQSVLLYVCIPFRQLVYCNVVATSESIRWGHIMVVGSRIFRVWMVGRFDVKQFGSDDLYAKAVAVA